MNVPPEKCAPPEAGKHKGGNATINLRENFTIADRRHASARAKLTPAQRGAFWQSVGDAIASARTEARQSEGALRG